MEGPSLMTYTQFMIHNPMKVFSGSRRLVLSVNVWTLDYATTVLRFGKWADKAISSA